MSTDATPIRRFRRPQLAIYRFFVRRTMRPALIWGATFGAMTVASAAAFIKTYSTPASLEQLRASFENNSAVRILLGAPVHIESVAGFVTWRALALDALIAGIWGLLAATRWLRGEEEVGRWEFFMSGQTTARRATINALLGLSTGVLMLFGVVAGSIWAIGRNPDIGFTFQQSLFYGLATASGAAMFMAVGAFISQLMPIRSRAAAISGAVFGVAFLIRAIGDVVSSVHWLVYLSPFGWIESLHPLIASNVAWMIPIVGFTLVVSGLAVYLAGKRDLGSSVYADKDSAHPHTRLLNSPLGLALRLVRPSIISWTAGTVLFAGMLGTVAKTAGENLVSTAAYQKLQTNLIHQAQVAGAEAYIGIAFFTMSTLLMIFTTIAVGNIREEEAEGYLDNLLVRRVGRLQWLWGRVAIIAVAVIAIGLLGGLAAWAGGVTQHAGLGFGKMLLAGLNCAAPALLLLGFGVLGMSLLPRYTTAIMYGLIAWAFLLEMTGSLVNMSHWLLDTSLMHHLALAPAVPINWTTLLGFCVLGLVFALVGAWRFNRRDLASE